MSQILTTWKYWYDLELPWKQLFQRLYYPVVCYLELCSVLTFMALIPFKLNTSNNYITIVYTEPTFYFRYKPYNLPMRFIQICDFYLCVQRFVNIFDLQIRHRAVLRWVHIQMQSYECNYIAKKSLFVRNLYNLIKLH